jgi:nitroimidazol reductase NimA-like FMN-containing flavoprotein (pyridoxamine 5'-phosphate oxidase superfamily)
VSVIAYGLYQELPKTQFEMERAHARKLLERYSRWWLTSLAERRVRTRDDSIAPLFFRIHVDSVTGLCGWSEGLSGDTTPHQ